MNSKLLGEKEEPRVLTHNKDVPGSEEQVQAHRTELNSPGEHQSWGDSPPNKWHTRQLGQNQRHSCLPPTMLQALSSSPRTVEKRGRGKEEGREGEIRAEEREGRHTGLWSRLHGD